MGSPWKFNSEFTPENKNRAPKGKDHLPSIIFQGRTVELRGWFRPYKWSKIYGSGFTGSGAHLVATLNGKVLVASQKNKLYYLLNLALGRR